jgi:hypothetical protein
VTSRPRHRGEAAQQRRQLRVIQPRVARRIHRRHHRLVEDVDVEMQPERDLGRPVQHVEAALQHRRHARLQRLEDLDPGDRGVLDILPAPIRLARLALADLDGPRRRHQRVRRAVPAQHQRVAQPDRQRQIGAGGRMQRKLRLIIAGVAKVAVAVEMDQREGGMPPGPGQGADQDRAVAADHQRKQPVAQRRIDRVGDPCVEAADGRAVAQHGARLRLGAVARPRQVDRAGGLQPGLKPGIGQHRRAPPGPRLVPGPQRPQPEIRRRPDQRRAGDAFDRICHGRSPLPSGPEYIAARSLHRGLTNYLLEGR